MWIKFAEKHNFGDIRNCLSVVTREHLIHAYVILYSLLYGLPNSCILKLQQIQNSAARIIYRREKFDHATPLLKQFHWLLIRQKREYKLLLYFKAQNGLAPSYLKYLKYSKSVAHFAPNIMLVVPLTKLRTYLEDHLMKMPHNFWTKLPFHILNIAKL